jgi:hypothetical protein
VANQFGIDLGAVEERANAIKAARIQNAFAPRIQEAQLRNADQQGQINAMQIAQAQQGMADDATVRANSAGALNGDPNSLSAIAAINPAKAKEFTDYVSGLDEKQRAAVQKSVDEAGRLANYVLSAPDPKAAYAEALTLLPKDLRAKAPAEYDEGWVKTQLGLATALHAMVPTDRPAAVSEPGKVAQDVANGYLSEEEVLKLPKDGGKAFQNEKDLAAAYNSLPTVKTWQALRDSYQNIEAAAADGKANPEKSGAADIALVYAYMKMLDPTSVVREGEFATAENSGGVGATIQNLYNKLLNGGRLNDDQRANYTRLSKQLYKNATDNLDVVNKQMRKRAEDAGVTADNFLISADNYQSGNAAGGDVQQRKSVGGKSYVQINGEWYEDDGTS